MSMKLQIERPYVEALAAALPSLASLKRQLLFGDRAEIEIHQLGDDEVTFLCRLYEQAGSYGRKWVTG